MEHPHISVSWDAYQKSICNGLSSLQQRGEFVDMTLAADGHLVRVHRMVLSLVSPYIKQLIASADCAHPVIFLNQISYKTLCSILEYVYTGEVHVVRENLKAFVEAGKALHIKGLEDMNVEHTFPASRAPYVQIHNTSSQSSTTIKETREDIKDFPVTDKKDHNIHEVFIDEDFPGDDEMDNICDDSMELENNSNIKLEARPRQYTRSSDTHSHNTSNPSQAPSIQYSVSNQGNLQIVLNRYLYYLVYTGKNSGHRRWQCIENKKYKCPAAVVTKNDVIIQRISAHNHSFHDQKILKKVQTGSIFAGLQQAQDLGKQMREERNDRGPSTSCDKTDDDDAK